MTAACGTDRRSAITWEVTAATVHPAYRADHVDRVVHSRRISRTIAAGVAYPAPGQPAGVVERSRRLHSTFELYRDRPSAAQPGDGDAAGGIPRAAVARAQRLAAGCGLRARIRADPAV